MPTSGKCTVSERDGSFEADLRVTWRVFVDFFGWICEGGASPWAAFANDRGFPSRSASLACLPTVEALRKTSPWVAAGGLSNDLAVGIAGTATCW